MRKVDPDKYTDRDDLADKKKGCPKASSTKFKRSFR